MIKTAKIPAWRQKGHSLTACNAAPPVKSKMAARGPQNGRWGLERCLPLGHKKRSRRRKREKNRGEKREKNDEISGHYVIAGSRPPECRTPNAGTPDARAKIKTNP